MVTKKSCQKFERLKEDVQVEIWGKKQSNKRLICAKAVLGVSSRSRKEEVLLIGESKKGCKEAGCQKCVCVMVMQSLNDDGNTWMPISCCDLLFDSQCKCDVT